MPAVDLTTKLEAIPAHPGVYQFFDSGGNVLYVGKAINLRNRVRQYFQQSANMGPRISAMVAKVADLETIVTDSEVEALILEANLIKKLKPRYNVDLKDDKSYPFIVITNEPFPRVFVTRRIVRDGSKYFGPYTDVSSMRGSLKMIREIFKVRSCNFYIDDEVIRKRRIRVCLDFHIKKCEGPCEGLKSQEAYGAMIREVEQALRGKTQSLIRTLEEQMHAAAESLRFEEAAAIRNRIADLRVYRERQKMVTEEAIDRDVFSIAVEGDDACGVVFKIREGKVIGRHHTYMSNVEGLPETEIIESLVQRHYLESEDIPDEVFLPMVLEDEETLAAWLSRQRKADVLISVPKIGEKAKLVAMCQTNARFLLDELKIQKLKRSAYIPHSLKSLERDLRLTRPPRRIECFDISTIHGSETVASMVVFEDGRPKKSEYRKFKIESVIGVDDFASMREVISRHYRRLIEEGDDWPDLIVIDGGKGQLSSAVQALEEVSGLRVGVSGSEMQATPQPSLPAIIGLAKRLEEVFVPGSSEAQSIPKTSSGLKLLQHIRDEAHRFAITYHRRLRTKRVLQTELDLIDGVGRKRAKELLEAFGSVQGVKFATETQLTEIVGKRVAASIKEYFDSEVESQNHLTETTNGEIQ